MLAGPMALGVEVAHAGDAANAPPDAASAQALMQTQQMLRDPQARTQGLTASPMGREVDSKVHELAGSDQNADGIYHLAADVIESVMKEAGGDPLKAQALLLEIQKDPAAWAAKWTPAQQQSLHDLSNRLPAAQATPTTATAPKP